VKNFGGDLAAVFGGFAQLVLRLLVNSCHTCSAAGVVAQTAVASPQGVVIPRFQLFGKITNLA